MKQTASLGPNRTGVAASEELAKEMQAGVAEFPPTSHGAPTGADKVRIEYARATDREDRGLGSVPPPSGVKGKAKAAVDMVLGHHPTILMDKLGERLAFERTGTRLYEALISKHEADGGFAGGPSRADLLDILNEEHRHFAMLTEVMLSLGGDPTAMTPSADLSATASMGVLKVVTDARTSLLQGLEAILIAELTDRDGWEALIAVANNAGKKDLVARFEQAELVEREHLVKVRRWIAAGQARPADAEAAQ